MSDALTAHGLKTILGREVEEIHLTIAKSAVLGLDAEQIAATLGVPRAEIEAEMEKQDYKDIRLLVGAEVAKERVERDTGWDGIESTAVRKLQRKVELEQDVDTLLRVAAVANRAQRRTAPPKESVLDPSQAGVRVPLTLTRRFVEKLNGAGDVIERQETQQISVLNGSAVNPDFKEVSGLLLGQEPRTAEDYREMTQPVEDDFSLDSLREMAEGLKHGR